jgi:hypothetical protein
MLCEICRTRPGSRTEIQGRQTIICSECEENLDLDLMYLRHLEKVARLLQDGNFTAALGELNSAENELVPHDRDGRIVRQLLSDRALVFQQQGDFSSALTLLQTRIPMGFDDPSDEAVARLGTAVLLSELGEIAKATLEAERCLDALQNARPIAALPVLLKLRQQVGSNAIAKRGSLVAAALESRGLRSPVSAESDPIAALAWAADQPT